MRTIVLVRFILASILISSVVPSGRGWAAEKKNDAPQIPTTKPTSKPTATAIVKLPAPAAAVCVGGGGKYLILHLKKLQQLAIFDVSQGKVVKYLPVPANELVFAAGLEKLFVGYKELRQIQRYDLESWKLELTVAGPEGGIGALAAGAGAAGPVLMLGADRTKHFWLMDPVTLKATPYPSKHWGNDGGAWGPVQIRMSFDGTTAVATGGGWAGIEISTIAGGKVNDVHAGGRLPGDVNVSGDGTLVFTDRSSILREDLETKVSGIDGSPFPADAPGFSLSWLKEKGKEKASLIVFANAEAKPLLLLHDLPEWGQGMKLSLAERIHLIPSQRALVMLGSGADELLVRKFDLVEEMAASGIDYLFVSSTPPTHAERGAAYSYEMKVLSKRGSVKSELQAGPPGMKLDADGKLQWTVPRDFGSAMASIIIQIADASGQTTFHTFTIRIGGTVPAAPAIAVTPTQKPEKPEKPNIPNVTEPQPPAPEAPEVTKLDEPFHEYHAAAAGKVLVFYQKKAKQLALYETATGTALGNIPVGADNALFACGMDAIIIALPDQKILQRYDLKTRARVKSATIANQKPIKYLRMGSASTGPLFMYFPGEMVAVNATTLAPLKLRGALPAGDPNWRFDFRVAADGSTIASWDSYASPSGFTITHLKNGTLTSADSNEQFSMANRRFTPTADGSMVMYESKFYNAQGKRIDSTVTGYANAIPTSDPRFFIAVREDKGKHSAAAICAVKDLRVLAKLDGLPDVGQMDGGDVGRCGMVTDAGAGEPRLVYLPEGKTLVAIPMGNNRFERIKLDLNVALAGNPASGNSSNVTEPQLPAPKAPEVTTLAEPFHEYHAAAGGKVLVFYQQKAKQLALYEAATGKTLGNIAIGADNAIFACGADAIIVALPDQKILQRYDLKTRTRVKSAPIPNQNPIKHIGMGNASAGPFFIYCGGEMVAINAVTLEPLKHRGALPSGDPNWWFDFRVSADGSTVVSWDSYASPSNYTITRLKNGAVVSVGSDEGFSMGNRRFTPTADGSLILYETKFYSAETKPLASTLSGYVNAIPTSDPRYFIAVKESKAHRSSAAICTVAERRVLAEVDALPDVGDTNGRDGGRCGVVMDMAGAGEPRLVYLAESKTLVAIPMSNDGFERIKVDLNAALAGDPASGNAATQALAVVSLPPKEAVVNEVYSYQLQVLPEKAVVTYKVESGPSGLAVSAKGLVTWKPTLRPIGGRANVILSVTDTAGHDVPHAFEIAVTRVAGAPADGVTSTGAIVKADEHRLELPDKEYRYVPGMAGKVLLLSGNQLAILAADGFTIEKTLTLPKSYQLIGERKNYYVAVCQEPRSIDLLDKTTLKIVRTRAVSFNALDDLTLHPTKPISYVSYVESGEGPTHHFMMFDETTAEARTNDNWLGDWLAISPEGDFLLAGFQETYRKGHEIIDNPDRIWIVPTYGSHDLLCRYDLDPRNGMPVRVASRDKVGGNGNGIRLSADGKRATYLSFTGYPQMSHNLGGWDPLDLSKLPVGYNVKDIATTKDLTFHPVLPMVACYGKASVVFFDRESGVKLDGKISEDALAGEDIQRVYFSPDGKSLIAETIVQGLHYLYHVPIKLSAEEIREVGSLPRPDKPLDAKPSAPAPGGIQKLPKVQA